MLAARIKKCQNVNFSSIRGSDFYRRGTRLFSARAEVHALFLSHSLPLPSLSLSYSTADNSIMYGLMYN